MAIDEMLMETQRSANAAPTLRIYGWNETCYTLGYFQSIDEQTKRLSRDAKLIRRLTGGGLVRHGNDVTFSLNIKEHNSFFLKDVKTSYLKINEALRHGLRSYQSELEYADCKTVPAIGQKNRHSDARVCFEAPACYDLLVRGRKVVGASQRRKGGILLHQSSLQTGISLADTIEGIVTGFREKWKVEFREEALTASELEKAYAIEDERYSDPAWASPCAVASKS